MTRATHLLERLRDHTLDEVVVPVPAVHPGVAPFIAAYAAAHYGVITPAIKHHVRKKYGLHGHIYHYKAQRAAIKYDRRLTRRQKREARRALYQKTFHTMTQHVLRHPAHRLKHPGGSEFHARSTAIRALHGTP